jgi:hypothetical protein
VVREKAVAAWWKVLVVVSVVLTIAAANGQSLESRSIFVSVSGADSNPGTKDAPLHSIQKALDRALTNRANNIPTHILIQPGTYRQSIEGDPSTPGNAPIVIEATDPTHTIISGADIWTGWQCNATLCQHDWPYTWGTAPNPWPNDVTIGELARRRELVIVNGYNLNQRTNLTDLNPGTFYVDETNHRIYLAPPDGTNLTNATIEVGTRSSLYQAHGLQNITLKGLTFRYAASPFLESAVSIASNTTVDNTTIEWNGNIGLSLGGDNIRITNTTMNHNGGDGLNAYKARNLLLDTVETSYNNWRGDRGNFHTWGVGQKLSRIHTATIRNYTTTHNASRGLWFDWDNQNITIDNLTACDNLTDGLFVEATQGPITITNATLCNNQDFGLAANGTHNLTLTHSTITNNGKAQLYLVQGDRKVDNWETHQTYTLNLENWTVTNNTATAQGTALLWWLRIYDRRAFTAFLESSLVNHNTYLAQTPEHAFDLTGHGSVNFRQWRDLSSFDEGTTYVSSPPKAPHSATP